MTSLALLRLCLVGLALLSCGMQLRAETAEAPVQARITADLAAGRPVVVHVVVALCDNQHQGIVPVPARLGNGQDPSANLYWGARYGVRTHLTRVAGWKGVAGEASTDPRVLERIVLTKEIQRRNRRATVYLVADAWDGAHIRTTTARFLEMAAGRAPESVAAGTLTLPAGGNAHLVGYVGHNGLMDFDLPTPGTDSLARPRDALVLACLSKPYFLDRLRATGAHPLLLTTGLMAPEAYTLDAAVTAWFAAEIGSQVRDRAGRAYDLYQKCGPSAARRLFWSDPRE